MPAAVFAVLPSENRPTPRVYLSPQRYIQGAGALDSMARYLSSLLESKRVAFLISQGGKKRIGKRLQAQLNEAGIDVTYAVFEGECCLEEIEKHAAALKSADVDTLLAIGGGKCLDMGKAVAARVEVPVVVVPTLASNDSPTSAVSVLYTPEGITSGAEFYPQNPALVVVDTNMVAASPERYLVAGMGDAMATWYEARVCLHNPLACTVTGTRPTLASAAIGEICAKTLFADGEAAARAVANKTVDDALERVVEANTLLSGIGFECGGLAGAHGVAQSCTGISHVHENYMHGEMVAIGTVSQLFMESNEDEARKVAEFFVRVGLPVCLRQIGIDPSDGEALDILVNGTLSFPFINNLPVEVTAELIRESILNASELGESIIKEQGNDAYRRLHG